MTKEDAIAFYEAKKWEQMTLKERALFQLKEPRLCMPFTDFHEAVGKSCGRPVYAHEFANAAALIAEIEKK
ncbi:MAG: hypothetical protein E6Q97_33410 [Desulfurellales bacterium]|nr:MAG: hypothetical protein E6Q97_33410 [Desulfurellales bacterium]